MSKLKTNFLLLTAAVIWGLAFVAQQVGMNHVGPLTFNGLRFYIGSLVLLPYIMFIDKQREKFKAPSPKWDKKILYFGGIVTGLVLAVASGLQQVALLHTSVGKVGFLTALYILFVPIIGLLFGKRAGVNVWIGVIVAVFGMYLLCVKEGFSIGLGDTYSIICAFIFSIQIMCVGHFSPQVDGIRFACLEFFVAGTVNVIGMFLLETPTLTNILRAALPLLYAGVLSSGVAYTFQIVAQKHAEPTIAALIMSLESVFSVLGGWVLLGQHLTAKESIGCIFMFAAIVLAQLKGRKGDGVK